MTKFIAPNKKTDQTRMVRERVRQLRVDGLPIVHSSRGYVVAGNDAQIATEARWFRNRGYPQTNNLRKFPVSKVKKTPVPKTQKGCENLIAKLGDLSRKLATVETEMQEDIAEIEAPYRQQANAISAEIESTFNAVSQYAQAHRDSLLEGDEKTATLATGKLMWKLSPESVELSLEEGVVIGALKAANLKQAVKVKESLDKTEVKKNKEKYADIAGIDVVRHENFSVEPNGGKLKRSETVRSVAA